MTWQPIETAPKDGRWIIAYAPEGDYDSTWNDYEGRWLPVTAVVRWPVDHPRHDDPELRDNSAMWAGYYDAFGPFHGAVTHWMPLPKPPGECPHCDGGPQWGHALNCETPAVIDALD